jgi:NADPH-dependent glutamate synthase beta subunit-like oxidoreductase/NAD(P)H-flavin reductase
MKACIYQKQEPVNIPQIETGVLSEVLSLPFGVEIYLLLTRWNPLNLRRPVPAPFHGKKVLVVGLGPAGYTLSHYLLNEGFGVVGIDGLKIEPLPEELTGTTDRPPRPVRDYRELYKNLDERVLAGFGGVSEYGITVRWDKNFLALIHLALARRDHFKAYGGIRFGGTLTLDDCWELGFDHVAIAAGAGKPTLVEMRGGLSRGIRQASDFLMALQLTGAFKRESLANLQIRLPAVVIGGGLTAIDTATELMAYYPLQVEKVLDRFEILASRCGVEGVCQRLDPEERACLDEFLEHGRAVRAERARALAAHETPNLVGLVQKWGGVTIAYRRSLQESPAYRLNHEEVIKCLEEGVRFAERLNPVEAILDPGGAVAAVEMARMVVVDRKLKPNGEIVRLPAKSVLVAAGTSPNVIYEREHPGTFRLDENGRFFASHVAERDPEGRIVLRAAARRETGFFTSYDQEGRFVSYYGDNHPIYAGNVVRAMGSARDGYPKVVELFAPEIAAAAPAEESLRAQRFRELVQKLDRELLARVERVDRLTPNIIELVVRAPMAARKFHPGQFYRLQNFEVESPVLGGTLLALEGIALTGAWVDPARGLLSLIVLEMGASSRLCAMLKPGRPIVVMGPTGSPTDIPEAEKVLLAGGGLGNAVLFSIAKAMREAGNHVVYFAGYKDGIDLFKREEIERATDQVIWSTDRGAPIIPARPQDRHFRGNIVQAMLAFATGGLGEVVFPLKEVNRILAIGSDRMMAAVKSARHGVLAPYLGPHTAIGSINSSMQCMLKEVCAQCLQQHCDPVTGAPTHAVFTCFCQDQILDEVDFGNLSDRLRMNSVQEKITDLWLEHLLETNPVGRA